ADAYYADAAAWAEQKGITDGIGNGLFGPHNNCTRAQIVTFLYRLYGSK
ncbi:MAG: S-layer homology domain-containing protein, partial [Butyricicoccus sp.]